jgi:hypothetical protein
VTSKKERNNKAFNVRVVISGEGAQQARLSDNKGLHVTPICRRGEICTMKGR